MNRWVGVVSLRETAAPTPVHRIALAIEAARKRTSYQLAGREVPYARMRAALRRLGQEHARRYEWERYTYCVELAGDFYNGGEPPRGLPGWLTAELDDALRRSTAAPRKNARKTTSTRHEPWRTEHRRPQPSHRDRPAFTGAPGRAVAGTSSRTPEPVRPYRRVVRRTTACDVMYPPLPALPRELAELVAEGGAEVVAAVRDTVGRFAPEPDAVTWLGLAAEHRSHLYEKVPTETVTPQVLGLLERLGATALDMILLDAYVRWAVLQKVGEQSSEHVRRRRAADLALGQWVAERRLARLGSGEAQQPARSVYQGCARQVLGVLSLFGDHETARRFVAAVWPDLDRPVASTGFDSVTQADAAFRKEGLSYDYAEDGPGHRKEYRATVRTGTGRTAHGTGPSKKAARAAAAGALLIKYPQAAQTAGARQTAPEPGRQQAAPLPYTRPEAGHRDAVADLAAMFELGHRADALLAQALTHASWIYENQPAAHAARQHDNQLLAHQGSFVVDHLAACLRTRHTLARGLAPDDDEARILTASDEDTARLAAALALGEGLLTGRGESGKGLVAVSDAAQAVVATAWRARGPELLRRRPAVLDEWLTGLDHRPDPTTVLNTMAITYGMTYAFEHRATNDGKHLTHYTATAVVRDVRGRTHQWTGYADGPAGKTSAGKATAQDILDVLAAASTDDLFTTLDGPQRDLLAYLFRAQLDGLGQLTERQRTRILARGDLGTDLLTTGDTEAFLAWADRVTTLLGPDIGEAPETLTSLYRRILDITRYGQRSPLRRMAADPGTDTAGTVRRLAAEAVRRAASANPRVESVRDVVQDWWRDQAPRTGVTVRDDMRQEAFVPLPAHLGALHETLTWCGEAAEATGTRTDVELTVQDGTLHVWIGLDRVDVRAVCDDFARLLSRTLPFTDCLVGEDHVLLRLHGGPDRTGLSPLAAAGLDAYLSAADAERPSTAEEQPDPGSPEPETHTLATT
ncbi:double-stranded RNA binding motif domain-containing protein [Streptomyces sp. NPDC002205]|uniref:double-stranded RNA binding motif domain-containing protein n=1 Tax=Streptomyces sp. NPDC002205 TaxID=3154411 RepID=UPI0033247F00